MCHEQTSHLWFGVQEVVNGDGLIRLDCFLFDAPVQDSELMIFEENFASQFLPRSRRHVTKIARLNNKPAIKLAICLSATKKQMSLDLTRAFETEPVQK
jgi:hypothetical protein